MTPLRILKEAATILDACGGQYCLIGGHAASLYRSQERFTRDVDFALVANPTTMSQELAESVISALGFKPMVGFIPPSVREQPRKAVCMITASPSEGEAKGVIDILLPELPWIIPAVERAQHNRINLGFAAIPVITPEDLILAKCYALNNAPDRFQDLDDLKEVFQNVKDLDFDYIRLKLTHLALSIPDPVRKFSRLAL